MLLLLGASCQGKWSGLLSLQMITGAKSKMWFTGFHSLFPIWYFNGKCLVYVSGASLLTCTVLCPTILFHFPVCQHSGFPWATAVCLSWEACGRHRSPNFSGHLPCNISLMLPCSVADGWSLVTEFSFSHLRIVLQAGLMQFRRVSTSSWYVYANPVCAPQMNLTYILCTLPVKG